VNLSGLKRRLEALERQGARADAQAMPAVEREQQAILLTKAEAAAALGFSVRWLEMQIVAGAPVVRIGRSVRMRRVDVEAFACTGKWPKGKA
jgi:hypothetical protein